MPRLCLSLLFVVAVSVALVSAVEVESKEGQICTQPLKDCRTWGTCKGCVDARTHHPYDYGHCGWCESSRLCQNTQMEHCLGNRWVSQSEQCVDMDPINRCRAFTTCDACVNAQKGDPNMYGDCSWCAATATCNGKWQETCDTPWIDYQQYCAMLPSQVHRPHMPPAGRCRDTAHLQTCEACFTAAITNPAEYGDCKWCESTRTCADPNVFPCINNAWHFYLGSCTS